MKVILRMVVDVLLPPSSGESNESGGTELWEVEKFLDLTQIPRVDDRVVIQGRKVTLIAYVAEVWWLYPELGSKSPETSVVVQLGLSRPIISVEKQLVLSFFNK